MSYLLDTNIISELISKNPDENVVKYINALRQDDVYLSVITIGEIHAGIQNVKDGDKKELLSKWLHSDLLLKFENRIVQIDTDIMLAWGEISHKLKVIGQPLPIMDSIIGAICFAKNFTLITRNEKDFKNLTINIINPFTNKIC